MRTKVYRVIISGLFALLLGAQFAQAAGTGILRGRVLDKASKDPLPGAVVQIQGTMVGMTTDLDGRYTLRSVPAGTQTVLVSYVGYRKMTREVTVAEDQTVDQDFTLTAEAVEGQEVVVTGQAKGQMAAINQQLSSNSIVNVVSADKMKELPDANIAESIGRLPGISLQRQGGEAYAVVVRGLSPKYNEVTIEGVPMSSTNYYDRGIDLSLLSDDLVRGVEVSKTLRADQDADALGGTINLTLKTAEPGPHFTMSGNGGYNNLRDTWKSFKFTASAGDRFLDDQVGILVQGNIEQKQLPSDQFVANYDAPTFQSTNKSFYVTTYSGTSSEVSLKRQRAGASVILDYASDLVDVKFYNVFDQKRDSTITRTNQSNFETNSFQYNINVNRWTTVQQTHSLSALLRLGGTELPLSLSFTRGKADVPNQLQFNFYQTNVPTIPRSKVIYGDPRMLMDVQGVMNPSSANSTLNDILVTNTNLLDESWDAKLDWKVPFTAFDYLSGKFSVGGKLHGVHRTSDQDQSHIMIVYGGGAANRIALTTLFDFLKPYRPGIEGAQQGVPAAPFVDPNYTRTSILGYPIGPGFDVNRLIAMQNHYYFDLGNQSTYWSLGPASFDHTYFDDEHTAAAYVMAELNVGSDLTVVPGLRWQQDHTVISAYHIQLNGSNQNGLAGQAPRLVTSDHVNPYLFPSVNAKYRVTENIQVVGAAYRSMSLPSFGEISPLVEYDVSPSVASAGNPLLRPSTSWNFDLGASYASNDVGLFTVNLFYKEISDLIYGMANFMPFLPYPVVGAPSDIWDRLPTSQYFDARWATVNKGTTAATSIPMNDPDKAYLRGIELSWQTHLWYLPGLLSGLVLDLNASYMSSKQFYPSFNLVQVGGTKLKPVYNLFYQTVSGPLQEQPRATYNAILGWDYMGFSSRFSLRFQQGTVRSFDTQFGLRTAYYDDVTLLDIALKQQLFGGLAVFANATNVNAHIDNYYWTHPGFDTYPAGQLPTNLQTYGWAVQFGVAWNY